MSDTHLEPEWSYLFDVSALGDAPQSLNISPDFESCTRLARRLNIISVDSLSAQLTIKRISGSASIHVEGTLDANITQECVVTGDSIETQIRDPFEAWYGEDNKTVSLTKKRQEKMLEKGHTELPMIEEQDDPEPVVDDHIDVGELVTQYLSLGINPYPKADGASYESSDLHDKDPFAFKNPFAGLKDWKDKLTRDE